MDPIPQTPYLVIRNGLAFWVETQPPGDVSATLQALEEGCFRDAWCYDASGALWPVVTATLKAPPSFFQRHLPWRRVPVELQLGPPAPIGVPDIIARLARVLRSDSEFCEHLRASPTDILRRFEAARTPGDVIRVAREYERPA